MQIKTFTPLFLLFSACAVEVADDVATTTQDLTSFQHEFSAQEPNPRLEIGRWGGCTATLIRANWALTSASCWRDMDSRNIPGASLPAFEVIPDGRNASQTIAVDRTFAFTQIAGQAGPNDLMLLHLSSNASGVTPATISTTTPHSGPAVQWGIGCKSDGTGWGVLRAFETAAGISTPVACSGDQGGPKTIGAYSSLSGPIYQVQSSFLNSYGDAVRWKGSIDAVIAEWDAHGAADIYKTGWCSAANERKIELEIDADDVTDVLCWNSVTGALRYAQGAYRLVRPTFATGRFCSGANKELLVGDFDQDRLSDLLCHDKTTGANVIAYGSDIYNGRTVSEPVTGWCGYPTGQLHVGDFNGDGYSDLLCHDTTTGHTWVDLNPRFSQFDGVSEIDLNTTFCSRPGDKLLIGDVDGNGMSDLICHTPSTGQIQIDRTFANDKFGGVDFELPASGTNHFCTTGRVEVGDYDGDGRSDLKCVTPTGTWPSLYASPTGTFSYDDSSEFGYSGDVAPRTIRASSRPWSYER